MAIDGSPILQSYLDWSGKGKASFWRYYLGLFLVIFVFFVLSGVAMTPLILLAPRYQESLILSVVATLVSFVGSFVLIPFVVGLVHQRPCWSVALPRLRFESWNFFTGLWVGAVVAALTLGLFSVIGIIPIEPNPDFNLPALLLLAVVGFVGIFIQAGSEEMLFRGYLTQLVRRFSPNRYLFIGIPALLFSVLHIANIASLGGSVWVMFPYLISGVLYGWAAYRFGSLWMPVSLHLANNYTSLVLVGTKGDALPSAAPFLIDLPGLPLTTLAVFVQSAAIVLALTYLSLRFCRQPLRPPSG
jgi:membrane protease YdiL (CAAX protease family)